MAPRFDITACLTRHTVILLLPLFFVLVLIPTDAGFSCFYGFATVANAFEWSAAGSRPEVNRKAIAGIWKLTPTAEARVQPMKEFTVYPKKAKKLVEDDDNNNNNIPDLLLMLKDDGSFQQYTTAVSHNNNDHDDGDVDRSWSDFQKVQKKKESQQQQRLFGVIKGRWDYLDGNLILAADRPDDNDDEVSYRARADGYHNSHQNKNPTVAAAAATPATPTASTTSQPKDEAAKQKRNDAADTLLLGRVVASYQTRLIDNPALMANATGSTNTTSSSTNGTTISSSSAAVATAPATTALDTHLSVPKGSINIGKFFYPRHHPSFFEQPMFQPVKKGTFQLRQVLGSLNTERSSGSSNTYNDNNKVEKYKRSDFYNRTFLLTCHPIGPSPPPTSNGDKRWSIKYNRYVYDPPSKQSQVAKNAQAAKEKGDDDVNHHHSPIQQDGIRVLQVVFHVNGTFSTVAGLGDSAILRGKFDVMGSNRDQLWMQVIRFGFGRSVSGSVYSEGRMLSHEDAKAYWGTITTITTNNTKDSNHSNSVTGSDASHSVKQQSASNDDDNKTSRLEVTGSVLDGWGLEPMPVACFIMRETSSELHIVDEDDDEEEDDDALSADIANLEAGLRNDDNGSDWLSDDSFQ